MKRLWTLILLACQAALAAGEEIHGAGATFPAPIYAAWAADYERETGVHVLYDAVGSGAGIDRVRRHQIDFGATDAPLAKAAATEAGLLQFPTVIGGVVPVLNIRGIEPGQLALNGTVLGEIYLGHITKWNDPAIARLNPGLALPGAHITVVHRADASGSSQLWSDYLSRSSPQWHAQIGSSLTPNWPVGIGGMGNEGVASLVQRTHFAIGYVEYFFARGHNLSDIALINHGGKVVKASSATFAAASAQMSPSDLLEGRQLATDPDGASSWPITGASFVLIDMRAANHTRTRATLQFFEWSLRNGAASARTLQFVPLPTAAAERLTEQLRQAAR